MVEMIYFTKKKTKKEKIKIKTKERSNESLGGKLHMMNGDDNASPYDCFYLMTEQADKSN